MGPEWRCISSWNFVDYQCSELFFFWAGILRWPWPSLRWPWDYQFFDPKGRPRKITPTTHHIKPMCTPVHATRAPIILSLKPLALKNPHHTDHSKKHSRPPPFPVVFCAASAVRNFLSDFSKKNRGSCQVPGGFGEGEDDDLVGGWTNPSEKYASQIGSFPQVGVKIKICLKPSTSDSSGTPTT